MGYTNLVGGRGWAWLCCFVTLLLSQSPFPAFVPGLRQGAASSQRAGKRRRQALSLQTAAPRLACCGIPRPPISAGCPQPTPISLSHLLTLAHSFPLSDAGVLPFIPPVAAPHSPPPSRLFNPHANQQSPSSPIDDTPAHAHVLLVFGQLPDSSSLGGGLLPSSLELPHLRRKLRKGAQFRGHPNTPHQSIPLRPAIRQSTKLFSSSFGFLEPPASFFPGRVWCTLLSPLSLPRAREGVVERPLYCWWLSESRWRSDIGFGFRGGFWLTHVVVGIWGLHLGCRSGAFFCCCPLCACRFKVVRGFDLIRVVVAVKFLCACSEG